MASGAEVGASAAYDYSLNGGFADTAWLAGAGVDVVVELEEAGYTFGIYVIGDGGAAEFDGMFEDFDEGGAEAGELGAGESAGVAEGSDAGVEESLVGIDVADAVEEGLVEQRGLDGGLAGAEEDDEVFERDCEGLFARAGIGIGGYGEAAEAAGVDEAELTAAAEGEDGVGVRWDGGVGGGDEEAACHAKMDQELGGLFVVGEVDDDGLAYAVNAVDAGVGEGFGDGLGWGFEGLGLVAGPDGADGLAVDALVDAVGYGFDFGEFGHAFAVYGRRALTPIFTDDTDRRPTADLSDCAD